MTLWMMIKMRTKEMLRSMNLTNIQMDMTDDDKTCSTEVALLR